jgi:dienelactone hydrolase
MAKCIGATTIGTLLITIGVLIVGFFNGWHIKKYEPNELAAILRPYFLINHPEGDGPFPTVVAYHGCGGMDLGAIEWMEYLSSRGYATILVDSSRPRGLRREQVCSGRKLWGSERAGDVLVSSLDVGRLPFVDKDRVVLLGWSHGAWAIMDLLAIDPPASLPTNLRRSPEQPLAGVKGIVLLYPFCGFPAKARGKGWRHDIPVLMLLAENDSQATVCLKISSILAVKNRPVKTHVYPNVDHAFDMKEEDLAGTGIEPSPEATADARLRVERFMEDVLRH